MTDTPQSPTALAGWRKSTHSATGACVELTVAGDNIAVRDSKTPEGAMLVFTRPEFDAFVRGVVDGEFDDLR
jgi:hypothetical protein